MITKMYRPRWIQKLWANFWGYFWLACHLCGRCFGGHEWGRWDHFSVPQDDGKGKGICFYCAIEHGYPVKSWRREWID